MHAAHKRNGSERGTRNRGRTQRIKFPELLRRTWRYRIRQRGLGRSGGRAVRERGRMRKRGPSGGGTLRRKSPQQRQWPSPPKGAVASARSQRPRASHCGLIHCTVKPGKNCILSPSVAAKLKADSCATAQPSTVAAAVEKVLSSPGRSIPCGAPTERKPRGKDCGCNTHSGRAGTADMMARILTRTPCGVKRKDYKILW